MKSVLMVTVFVLAGSSIAAADDAAVWIERSHDAVFESSQTVRCQTPDGQVDGVFEVTGTGYAVEAGQGVDAGVVGADGVFGSTGDSSYSISVPTDAAVGFESRYESVELASERFEGRRTKAFHLIREGVIRAEVEFDHSTGAVLSMTTFNSDGSEYCSVETTSFIQPLGFVEPVDPFASEPVGGLEPIDPDPVLAPSTVTGFSLLETYRWRRTGSVSFYTDGLFSFTLVNAPQPFVLDESDAEDVELEGGTYRRLFEPGRSTYVWESEMGGMSIVGDLPLDLQETVLAELAPVDRPGLLTRLWRRLFR
jgi:hypothetical protein